MAPTVTIVTISYQAGDQIGATIDSVLSQTFRDYEYVFVDGGSKDHTVPLIREAIRRCEAMGVAYQMVSEPDRGIYDAMNKAVRMARGQWVLMLNAGDVLAHPKVLEQLFSEKNYDADVIYGDVIYKDKSKNKTYYKRSTPLPLTDIRKGMVFCHQCVFVRGSVIKKYGFDTQYRIVADYDSFVRMYLDGNRFKYIQKAVSIYDCTGVSTANLSQALDETNRVKQMAGFLTEDTAVEGKLFRMKNLVRRLIQQHLPGVAYAKCRGWSTELPQNMD